MTGLKALMERAIQVGEVVIKYRFFFIVYAFMIYSRQYAIKMNKARQSRDANVPASFVQFQEKANVFWMIAIDRQIKLKLNDVIMPEQTKDRRDCETRLARKLHSFIGQQVLTENNVRIHVDHSNNGTYYGEIIIKGTPLGNTLTALSLAYPKKAPREADGSINWCQLLSQYERA